MNANASNRETKRDRFVRIIERRVNKALEGLENIAKCSNRRNYQYTEQDVRQIFTEIEKKVRETRAMYQEAPSDKPRFKLIDN